MYAFRQHTEWMSGQMYLHRFDTVQYILGLGANKDEICYIHSAANVCFYVFNMIKLKVIYT